MEHSHLEDKMSQKQKAKDMEKNKRRKKWGIKMQSEMNAHIYFI